MKLIIIAAAFLASQLCLALEHKLDRFTGAESWSINEPFAERHSRASIGPDTVTLYASPRPGGMVVIFLRVGTTNRSGRGGGWRYLGFDTMNWLFDGKPKTLSPAMTNRDVSSGWVSESFTQPLSLKELVEIGSSERVELRIGLDEFVLPAGILAAARDAAANIRAATATKG